MTRDPGTRKKETRESYLALVTGPGGDGSTTPIFRASNPVGNALLSTGILDLAGPTLASMASLLPVGPVGLEVREALYRFDANAHVPSIEGGVVCDNRAGEALGTISLRCLLTPDDYEATPSGVPPVTEIQASRPQRFVMDGGRMTFQDRRQGGLRFFGTGRTFPITVNGRSRLLFAGTATVLEGVGGLQGVRGTLLVSGELTPGGISMTIVGRLDPDGPLPLSDPPGMMEVSPVAGAGPRSTTDAVFVFAGEGTGFEERLRSLRIGNDLGTTGQLRSLIRTGEAAGSAAGALTFDTTDRRCGVRLGDSRRVLTFTDGAGRAVASIAAASLEGTAFRDTRTGAAVQHVVAAGPVTDGTGALTGAAGVLAFDTIVGGGGTSSTLYVLRLADPAGRFRAASNEVYTSMHDTATTQPSPEAAAAFPALQFVETNGSRITDADRAILAHAERTLAEGLELQRWFEETDRTRAFAEQFEVVREFNQDDSSFGFFDRASIGGRQRPVMGIVQEMFYDRQKHATGEAVRDQLREFVLRYFMRVSHLRQPEAAAGPVKTRPSNFQRALSWLPEEAERRVGMGYQQLYYKLRDSGKVGKFSDDERQAIVDLRDIGTVYAWILLKVDIFDFNLSFAPFGSEAMKVQMPMKESTYLVLGPPFVTHKENPEPGVLAEYGYGYAFVPYAPEPGPIAYGPGNFALAIQTVNFKLLESGEIRARAAFVVNRPEQLARIDIDPINWGFQMADVMTFNFASRLMGPFKAMAGRLPLRVNGIDPIAAYIWMANTMTGGLAGKQLGIRMESLEKRMLVQHFMQHHAMLINSLLVWRLVPDWTAEDQLPEYCNKGIRC